MCRRGGGGWAIYNYLEGHQEKMASSTPCFAADTLVEGGGGGTEIAQGLKDESLGVNTATSEKGPFRVGTRARVGREGEGNIVACLVSDIVIVGCWC